MANLVDVRTDSEGSEVGFVLNQKESHFVFAIMFKHMGFCFTYSLKIFDISTFA